MFFESRVSIYLKSKKAFDDMINGFGTIAGTDPTTAKGTDKSISMDHNLWTISDKVGCLFPMDHRRWSSLVKENPFSAPSGIRTK